MLQLAASLADQAPVSPGESITGTDDHNVGLLVKVLHTSGRLQSPDSVRPHSPPSRVVTTQSGCQQELATVEYATLPVGEPRSQERSDWGNLLR
jgi:hypothetical protein